MARPALQSGPALQSRPAPYIEDNLAAVRPCGFDPGQVSVPTLLLHGGRDRVVPQLAGEWLAGRIPAAELWLRPEDGHITVMAAGDDALRWLAETDGPNSTAQSGRDHP